MMYRLFSYVWLGFFIATLAGVVALATYTNAGERSSSADVSTDSLMMNADGLSIATFAGGCFWCVESRFEKVPGVSRVVSGYSGGDEMNPDYKQVSSGGTGHVEAVQIYFDPERVSYNELLAVLWREIDPTDNRGQFVDRGLHYRPVIFFHSEEQKTLAEASRKALQDSGRFDKPVVTEVVPFKNFFAAEEYHQDYYKKNPVRYKYYRYRSGRDQFLEAVWGEDLHDTKGERMKADQSEKMRPKNAENGMAMNYRQFKKPAAKELKQRLSDLQYRVTQQDGTEAPFDNAYWNEKRAGIYVDVVSGEPLFSSQDKYDSKTGWPSFTRPLNDAALVDKTDYKMLYPRTEVRSRYADSHLGHVFNDGPQPAGLRYCINSAALRFIPQEEMSRQGYGELLSHFEKRAGK